MRILRFLVLLAVVAFIAWPYYHVFRLDNALSGSDTEALGKLVDISSIRSNYKERLEGNPGMGIKPDQQDTNDPLARLQQNLRSLGDTALEKVITLDWVRDTLRDAVTRATEERPAYFMGSVTFAFFESYDSFIIRLGELGKNATHVRMKLQDQTWQVTDIIP